MSNTLKKFKVLSIGTNCFGRKYIEKYIEPRELHVFDRIGTTMWSIVQLVKNDFDGLLDKNNFELTKIYENDVPIYVNQRYFAKFLHDDFSDKKINETAETYKRRIDRFKQSLKSNKFIIFLRIQEWQVGQILNEECKKHNQKREYEYLEEFSEWATSQQIQFRIIYIGQIEKKYDDKYKIICLNDKANQYVWETCEKSISKLLENNEEFIIKCLP
jgi:hypothetical protein